MKLIFTLCIALILFLLPVQAEETTSSPEIEITKQIESPYKTEVIQIEPQQLMTESEMEDLLGPDPYLGQTDWLSGKKKK